MPALRLVGGLLSLGVGWAACAQTPLFLDFTNAVAAASTVTNNAVIGVANNHHIGFGFRFALAGATGTSSNVTATIQSSIDGTNYVNFATLALAANGTNVVGIATNLQVGGIPFLRVSTVQNQNTQAVSGLLLMKFTKTGF